MTVRSGPPRVLIAGCGLVGGALGIILAGAGYEVWGIRRSGPVPAPIRPLALDVSTTGALAGLPQPFELVFYLVSPGERTDTAYRRAYVEGPARLLEHFRRQDPPLRRFFFSSSTAVFGEHHGCWVNETTPAQPESVGGHLLLEGERTVLDGPFSATIVRFSGIYGPSRTRLLNRVMRGEEPCVRQADVFTNRIHVADCARTLAWIAGLPDPAALYLASDDVPVLRNELIRWLALRTGAPEPPLLTDLPASRSRGNKRCSNALLRGTGYRFQYPSYREGYEMILNSETRLS